MKNLFTPKEYRSLFDQAEGSMLEKMKYLLENFSHRWEWDGGDSLVIDMLDDQNISAEDIFETLAEAIEHQELNQDGRNAFIATKLALMRRPVLDADKIKLESWMHDENFNAGHYSQNSYNAHDDKDLWNNGLVG